MKVIFAVASAIAVVVLLCIQIAGAENATKTETALYGVLQFVFSIAVSWLLALISSEQQFRDSQKKFAIAAFRRIKEIERALTRTQRLVTSDTSEPNTQAVVVSLMSAQDAVNSSIADWGDVIGDEISTTKEIEKLRKLQTSADKLERGYLNTLGKHKPASDVSPRIQELTEALPPQLKIEEEESAEDRAYEEARAFIDRQLQEKQAFEFSCFYDSKDSFQANINTLKVGDKLHIAKGYSQKRRDALFVYLNPETWIAVATNPFSDLSPPWSYDEAMDFVERHLGIDFLPPQFGGHMVPVTVSHIREQAGDRHHFTVSISTKDIHTR